MAQSSWKLFSLAFLGARQRLLLRESRLDLLAQLALKAAPAQREAQAQQGQRAFKEQPVTKVLRGQLALLAPQVLPAQLVLPVTKALKV
jgi:hypothetical protein